MDSTPAVMTAAYITGHGPADGIRVGDLPVPVPGPTDVLVRTEALAANHVDTFVRSGAYRTHTPFPFIIGRDLVGTVAAVGAGVSGFQPGDPVWCNSLGHGGRQGSFAQYAIVPVERLYRLPKGVAPDTAVSVLHTAATAHIGLFREGRIRVGDTVFVNGAAGGVGSAVIQLAVAAGARVVATASERDTDWCLALGAHTVVDYRDPHVTKRIQDATPDGVDIFWDNSGENHIEATLPLLAQGGRIIVMAGLRSRPILPAGELYLRDISIRGFVISNASISDLQSAATTINGLLARDGLRTRIGATLSLSEAAEAHRLQESRGPDRVRGRIVVLP
ncbi:NADPH:quinone reductase [Nonomuraea sp. NPDC026600]|uniref:NADPH:quinone reductase n=1 Tax=Nonomuraea sp. NPDC026600 TaxID=3155363 RepID=UPI0033EDE95A